jgi:hypothetical protein
MNVTNNGTFIQGNSQLGSWQRRHEAAVGFRSDLAYPSCFDRSQIHREIKLGSSALLTYPQFTPRGLTYFPCTGGWGTYPFSK